jgi:hypothetical protein
MYAITMSVIISFGTVIAAAGAASMRDTVLAENFHRFTMSAE